MGQNELTIRFSDVRNLQRSTELLGSVFTSVNRSIPAAFVPSQPRTRMELSVPSRSVGISSASAKLPKPTIRVSLGTLLPQTHPLRSSTSRLSSNRMGSHSQKPMLCSSSVPNNGSPATATPSPVSSCELKILLIANYFDFWWLSFLGNNELVTQWAESERLRG